MKAVRSLLCLGMTAAMALLAFSACSVREEDPFVRSDAVRVTFVDDGQYHIAGGNTFSVPKGEDLTVTVTPSEGLYLRKSDYAGSTILYGDGAAQLTLPAVTRTQRVRLEFVETAGIILYDANGGTFAQTGEELLAEPYDLSHHIRQNTNTGRDLSREGYTLIGWNTSADGGGAHIGLGSRVSVGESGSVLLYAEWAPWTDASAFLYTQTEDGAGIRLTGYRGGGSTVCIPPAIGGLPVLYIGAECFAGCEAETVILPDTALSVEIDAFRGSGLRELYLFDNIESISDHCFRDCPNLQTLHINAVEAPKWTDYDRHSAIADKYDILIEHRDSPKIVVFGGSGPYFSIDTRQMTDALAQEGYVVLNMAINAHFNAYMQFAMIEPYMRAGDILIHIPETGPEQMMAETTITDERIWHGLEGNFDLVSLIDIRGVRNIFSSFHGFNVLRSTRPDKTYADYVAAIDDLGNWGYVDEATGEFTTYKPERGTDTPFTHESVLETAFLAGDAVARRTEVYRSFEEKGVRVFLSNAALNVDGLAYSLFGGSGDEAEKLQGCFALAEEFDRLNAQAFPAYPVLVGMTGCLYRGGRFYNSDYHLGSAAAAEHTEQLLQALLPYLEGEAPARAPRLAKGAA